MRESKYDSLLNVSIVILIVSTILLGITGYNIFFKKESKTSAAVALPGNKDDVRDSLRQVYSNTVKNLNSNPQITVGAADKNAQENLDQMTTLRTEIDSLLQQHGSEADLATAKIKIEELQRRVAELEGRYTNAEAENKRLQALINKLIVSDKSTVSIPSGNEPRPDNQNPVSVAPEKTIPVSSSVVAGLHLFAVTDNKSNEEETTSSGEAEKIVGSFLIKNNAARSGGEVVVVVLQPDGKVIKNSVWESGTFDTREGKKVYSRKIYFDPAGDEKQLNFSLVPDKFLKGDYTMQIWYNGSMVGKMVKTLS